MESIWPQGEKGLLLSGALHDGYPECPAWAGDPSTGEGHSLPCRISSGSRSAGAVAAPVQSSEPGASTGPVLPALVQVQPLDVPSQPLSLPSQGAKGKHWKLLGCLFLSWPLAFPCIHKAGKTSKAESWYCLHGHYSKVCQEGRGWRKAVLVPAELGGPTYIKWLSLALPASLLAVLHQCFHQWSST